MAQSAISQRLKRVTALIFGTTRLQNLKEMIGEPDVTHEISLGVMAGTARALDIGLTEEVDHFLGPRLSVGRA